MTLFLSLLIFLATIALIIFAVIKLNPAFGAPQSRERLKGSADKPNHDGRKFSNLQPIKEDLSANDYKKIFAEMIRGNPKKTPPTPLPVTQWTRKQLEELPSGKAIWLGHSALYLKLNGKHILIDPMLSKYPSPVPYVIGKRFNNKLPIPFEAFPTIDLIVLTHDHYDHLDYASIMKLKDQTHHFLTPTGVGAHLEKWGIAKEKITELYWEENTELMGIKFTSMPTQHFSGRGPKDKMHTLWCSWVIQTSDHNIFFSGDSGYFDGFQKIGKHFGPFDICFMECGQYNELWPDLHMFPEETAQAFLDVKGKKLVPIHWGGFALSTHDWDDPIKRLSKAAEKHDIIYQVPELGKAVTLKNNAYASAVS